MKKATVTVLGIAIVAVIAAVTIGGCADNREDKRASATQPVSHYPSKGARPVPDYLKGTIYEKADMKDVSAAPVSGFGLVGELRGTGDNSAVATTVRDYIRKELLRTGVGSFQHPVSAETILRDSRYAIVRVDALIPPGARKEDRFDILVSAPAESYTTSLSHGVLYSAALKYMGADVGHPGGLVNASVTAHGPVFVNPQYALQSQKNMDPAARKSLLYGVVMDGGVALYDNALVLQLRDPQFAATRAMEARINQRFQGVADKTNKKGLPGMAMAQDEAIVYVYVPRLYRGDWAHFAGVVKHLYLDASPGNLAIMAERLAAAAEQPDAPLENISYAWEGIGEPAQLVLAKAMQNPKPEIAYAAARAAAFIGDDLEAARNVLVQMAKTENHPFRLNAVKTLGDLPSSSETNQYLRQLINVENTPVRIEAYKALARNNDHKLITKVIQEKFVLDMVSSSAPPMIYATRRGIPRIAIVGMRQSLRTPVTFAAIDSRLTLTADEPGGAVTIFYRSEKSLGDNVTTPIRQTSRPDLEDIIARLGGETATNEQAFDFSYADVVSLIQTMHKAGKLVAKTMDGQEAPITLMIEEQTGITTDDVMNAPQIPESRQQNTDEDSAVPAIPDTEQPQGTKAGGAKPAEGTPTTPGRTGARQN